jgi:DNA polymerase I-like protein with 3'-5' exonuclease and polymerase domains
MRSRLFGTSGRNTSFPEYSSDTEGFLKVSQEALGEGQLGLDLEFDPTRKRPHIIGVASRERSAGIWWDNELAKEVIGQALEKKVPIVGHAVMDADKPVVEHVFGWQTPDDAWEDSMILGYLCNSDFASMPGKQEDENDKGSLGLMNLWSMGSYYTNLPQWKKCTGKLCDNRPCPTHNERWYCAVDAWAGNIITYKASEELKTLGISRDLYTDLKRLTRYCSDMSAKGIKINRDLVAQLETKVASSKSDLFPSEMRLRTERCKKESQHWLTPFNPNSPKQKCEYFKEFGISLVDRQGKPSANKETVRKALERELRRLKVHHTVDKSSGMLEISEGAREYPQYVEYLYCLDQFMRAGKGLKSWFDEKYFDKKDIVHPRFIVTGTSTGRLASSSPNFQNVGKRGWASMVRAAIVPRSDKLQLVRADKGQLELRIVLFYAGAENPAKDAFTWLTTKANGAFDRAASKFSMKPRDIAKSVAHAGNYLEGLVWLSDQDLRTTTKQREIKAGALLVFEDWVYRGGCVGVTGANLAERLFGDRSYEHRKDALAIQEIYFNAFPSIRNWHRKVSQEIDSTHMIHSHTGRALRLYGSPTEDLKLACAFLGQGGGADEVQEAMLRYQELDQTALIQVHDELVFEVPKEWDKDKIVSWFEPFCQPSKRFGNWIFPIDISVGDNWGVYNADTNPGGMRGVV